MEQYVLPTRMREEDLFEFEQIAKERQRFELEDQIIPERQIELSERNVSSLLFGYHQREDEEFTY